MTTRPTRTPARVYRLRSILAQGKRPWSAAEVRRLKALAAQGLGKVEIARRLGRSASSVAAKLDALGLSLRRARAGRQERPAPPVPSTPGRSRRACLCCGAPFWSEGPHNRLCGECRRREADPFDLPVRVWGPS